MARERDRLRQVPIAAALVLLLLALLWVIAPPAVPETPPPVAVVAPVPTARRPMAPPSPTVAAPESPVDTDLPAPPPPAETFEWASQGHDAPPCGEPVRPPSEIPSGSDCTEGDLAIVCASPLSPGADIPSPAEVERIAARAATIVGTPRRTPLYVMVHDERTWKELAADRRLPKGTTGLYDGTVHLSPQPEPKRGETLRHELFHAVLDGSIRCVPRSVHEGLASWFAGETRETGWADSLRGGFFGPEDLDAALGFKAEASDRTAAYGQAEARVALAAERHGLESLPAWVGWLGLADREDASAAWDALDAPTDDELREHTSQLLFGASFDPALLRAWSARTLSCDVTPREWGPPERDCASTP